MRSVWVSCCGREESEEVSSVFVCAQGMAAATEEDGNHPAPPQEHSAVERGDMKVVDPDVKPLSSHSGQEGFSNGEKGLSTEIGVYSDGESDEDEEEDVSDEEMEVLGALDWLDFHDGAHLLPYIISFSLLQTQWAVSNSCGRLWR